MSRENSKRVKKRSYYGGQDEYITREKKKARDLRHTAWWRRKTASGICYYCGGRFSPGDLTMDHKIPLSRGGRSEKINLVPACRECNNRKKYLLPVEWDEYLENLKSRGDDDA